MSNWIRTGNFEEYRKAGLLSPNEQGRLKKVLIFFEQVEELVEQCELGYFDPFGRNWHLWSSPNTRVFPSHFQLLTAPTH